MLRCFFAVTFLANLAQALTPHQELCLAIRQNNAEEVLQILNIQMQTGGSDNVFRLVNTQDSEGRTPLHWTRNPSIFSILINHGANPNILDRHERTPLFVMFTGGHGPINHSAILEEIGSLSFRITEEYRTNPELATYPYYSNLISAFRDNLNPIYETLNSEFMKEKVYNLILTLIRYQGILLDSKNQIQSRNKRILDWMDEIQGTASHTNPWHLRRFGRST